MRNLMPPRKNSLSGVTWKHTFAPCSPYSRKMNLSSGENSNSSKRAHLLYRHQIFSKHNQEAAT